MSKNDVSTITNRSSKPMAACFSTAKSRILAIPAWKVLAAFYLFFSLLRIAMAFAATKTPVIMPDSALYLHLSRSILRGEVLFRGQPIRYEYILYPLLLSPLHLLPSSISIFRAVQVYNSLLMHLAVFPAYALARSITTSHQKGLLVALLTMLMPDFLIMEHVMVESLAFPVILYTCYAFYKFYEAPQNLKGIVLCGFLGFLLYAIKPGFAAIPVSFFLLLLWEALRNRDAAKLYQSLTGILSMLGCLGLYTILLRKGLHLSATQATLYGNQTHPLTWEHLLQTFKGIWLYGAFVPLAFCFFPLYLPFAHVGAFEKRDRHLLKAVLLSIALIIAGTVYVIYYDELGGGDSYAARIHVRYLSALLPVLMAFAFSPAMEGRPMNTKLAVLMAFSLVCFIRWDGNALLSGSSYPVDALLLTASSTNVKGFDGKLLWPMLAMVFLLTMGYRLIRHGYAANERRILCIFLSLAFVFSCVLSFSLYRHHNDSIYPEDAKEAVSLAGIRASVGIVRDGATFWPEAAELDIASRCALPIVELNDLLRNTNEDGTIASFIPKTYWQENAVNRINAPSKLILTNDILNGVILTDVARESAVSTSNGGYCVVTLTPGQPWVHSGLSGLNEGWVSARSRFMLFDGAVRAKGSVTLQLQARAGEGQAQLLMRYGKEEQVFGLTDTLTWITAVFTVEDAGQALVVELENKTGNVFIQTYLVE